MSKRYEIEKITDILQIPEESFNNFMVDLESYYHLGKGMSTLVDEISAIGGVRTQTVPQKFVWIDDGKHDAKVVLVPKEQNNDQTNP